jgi:hypothetical protein
MADWLKDLQRMILGMDFVPMDQRERFAAGIPFLPPEDLNRFLDLLMSFLCGQLESELARSVSAIRHDLKTAEVLSSILRETITEDKPNA